MKNITLILTAVCTLGLMSSCCCQTQSAPPLRPMPANLDSPEIIPQPTPTEPTVILDNGKGK